jgi:CheY-like chemotaxis protein
MNDNRMMPVIHSLATSEVSNWTVLIVDDEPDNRVIAEKVLTFNGAKVVTAENGVQGMAVLEETYCPSFILLDLSMPEMDGWEMLKRLRADSRWNALPVIALTAHAMIGDRERVMQAGFDGYIAKPFRLSTFMAELIRSFRSLNGQRVP